MVPPLHILEVLGVQPAPSSPVVSSPKSPPPEVLSVVWQLAFNQINNLLADHREHLESLTRVTSGDYQSLVFWMLAHEPVHVGRIGTPTHGGLEEWPTVEMGQPLVD